MLVIMSDHYTQQCFAVPKFFASCSRCCFDRSGLHSSIGLQDTVDNTRKTEEEWSCHDEYGEHHDRANPFLFSYLVGDIIDRTDLGYIKGGSLSYA